MEAFEQSGLASPLLHGAAPPAENRPRAESQALLSLGLPGSVRIHHSKFHEFRRPWLLRTDQNLRREASGNGARRFEAERIYLWKKEQGRLLEQWLREEARGLLENDLATERRAYTLGRPAGRLEEAHFLSLGELRTGTLRFDPEAEGGPAWRLRLASGEEWPIYAPYQQANFSLQELPSSPLGVLSLAEAERAAELTLRARRAEEISQLSAWLKRLPGTLGEPELRDLFTRRTARVKQEGSLRPSLPELLSRPHEPALDPLLYELLLDLRYARFREDIDFWDARGRKARRLGRPAFSLAAAEERAASRAFADPAPARPLPEIREFSSREIYTVVGSSANKTFRLQTPSGADDQEWRVLEGTSGGPSSLLITTREPIQVWSGLVALPSPLHQALTSFRVKSSRRELKAGVDYELLRNARTEAYAMRLRGTRINKVHFEAEFALPRRQEEVIPPIPAGIVGRLAKELFEAGERPLSAALRRARGLSPQDLATLIEAHTSYSYWLEPGLPNGAAGRFADFAPFFDSNGRLCGQCLHTAELLQRLLSLAYEETPDFRAEVVTTLLRRRDCLIIPRHAVVDLYWRGALVTRLDPTGRGRDLRAPYAGYLAEQEQRLAREEATERLRRKLAELARLGEAHGATEPGSPFWAIFRYAGTILRWAEGELTTTQYREQAAEAYIAKEGERLDRWGRGFERSSEREKTIQLFHLRHADDAADLTRLTSAVCEKLLLGPAEQP